MTPEEPSREQRELSPRLRTGLRWLGATAAAAVLAVGVHAWDNHQANDAVNRALTPVGNLYDVQPQDITGDGLPTIPPRHEPGEAVTGTETQTLKNATVAVIEGTPGDRQWHGDETGLKVSFNGQNYVLAAAHGFDGSYHPSLSKRAVDMLTATSDSYALADPALPPATRDKGYLLGNVTGAAIIEAYDATGPDIALLKIKPKPPTSGYKGFKNITAIPLSRFLGTPPKPGAEITMHDIVKPAANPKPITENGTYLGRVFLPAIYPNEERLDIVGLKPDGISENACEEGGSGSSFTASKFVSGPLFFGGRAPSVPVPFGEQTDQQGETSARWQIQHALHANLSEYTVLCAFTVVPPDAPAKLVKGFGVQVDPYR